MYARPAVSSTTIELTVRVSSTASGPSPALHANCVGVEPMTLARANPAVARERDRDRLVGDDTILDDRRNGLDQRASRVAESLGVSLDLRDDEIRQRLALRQDTLQILCART